MPGWPKSTPREVINEYQKNYMRKRRADGRDRWLNEQRAASAARRASRVSRREETAPG